MSRVFFCSDLHFGHKNLVEGIRGMSVTTSDNLIIQNWNKVVTKRDIVYILGDVTMEKKKDLDKLKQLNGKIYVVGGNHDTRKVCGQLQKMGITVMGVLEYKGFICTHVPVHPTQLYKTRGNIHGHLHLTNKIKEEDLGGRYYNVNTEFHNYTPILFDDIVKYFEEYERKKLEENNLNQE